MNVQENGSHRADGDFEELGFRNVHIPEGSDR